MKLTSAVQESLLALMCYDTKAVEVSALLEHKVFDPYFSDIAEQVQNYIQTYKTAPNDHTVHIIETLSSRYPDKADFYARIFSSLIVTYKTVNKEYVLKETASFVRYQNVKRSLSQAVKALQREDEQGLIAAEGALQKGLERNDIVTDLGISMSDPDKVLAFMDNEELVSFPTGLKPLDVKGLGPARKRLYLFIGLAGSGKSWHLCHLAKHAMLDRKKVLYISLELSEQEVAQRMVQTLFSVAKRPDTVNVCRFETDEFGKFVALHAGEEIRRLAISDPSAAEVLRKKLTKMQTRSPILIKEFPTGSLTFRDLENYLDLLEARKNFIPDLLIIDYADLMNVDSKNFRIDVGQIYKKLRGMAINRNIALATATQANRSSMNAKWLDGASASEDFSKIATSDTVITFNQTPAEHSLGLARLFVAKGRTDRDKFAILINQAYAIGQFALDCVEYTPAYFDDLKSFVVDSISKE